jgi:murein DD-endopeptidase MepM/ murein hydrolase activator NlpD
LVVQLPDGRYASYAHLQPGSLRVKAGDTVREGQSLARIGNSGNSFAPHLHFQLGDSAELLASEGLPFALREFELVGRLNSLPALLGGTPWTPLPSQPARMVRSESLLENMIVRIPAAARAQGRAVPGRK